MLQFDIYSDGRFIASLDDLGLSTKVEVLLALQEIMRSNLDWSTFTTTFGWKPIPLLGPDTYPGAIELASFALPVQSGEIFEIVASKIGEIIVVCALARKLKPGHPSGSGARKKTTS